MIPEHYESDVLLFFDGKPVALGLYETFFRKLLALFPDVGIRVQKTQITFTNPRVFACVSMARVRSAKRRPKEYIVVTLGLGERLVSDRVDAATEPYPGRWTNHIQISQPEELDDELMGWVRAAYIFSAAK